MENIVFNLPYEVKVVEPRIKNNIENMVNFSIVLITKNKERNLPNFLNSLSEFKNRGGEVCLLDTGSIDRTINIASEWGCKIENGTKFTKYVDREVARLFNEKFNADGGEDIIKNGDKYFDFSEAKNYISNLTSNDMILMLGCDVENISLNIDNIEKYITDGYNQLETTNNECCFYNRRKYKWKNIIHEILVINEGDEIKKINLGDNLKLEYNQSNISDTLIGSSLDCFYNQNDYKISQKFGIELMNHNFLNSAIREFNRNSNIYSSLEKSQSLVLIGDCLMKQKKDSEALDYYNKSFLEYSNRRLPLYKMGEYFFQNKMWDKCIFYLEGCLNITNFDPEIDTTFHYQDGPYSMLYIAHWWNGDKKKGKYYFDKALSINPYHPIYLGETKFHYEYLGTNIIGTLSFQETQYLYNESKKVKSVLEIGCDGGRSTHSLLNGCKGLVTVVTKNYNIDELLNNVGNYGNIKLLQMSSFDAEKLLENETFDMIFIHSSEDIKSDILLWEKHVNVLLCGDNYEINKKIISETIEISDVKENVWYETMNKLQKSVIYKSKSKPINDKRKIALCISGYLRTFEDCYPSILENVIQDNNVDIFIHTYDKIGHSSGWRSPIDLSENINMRFLESLPNLKTLVTEKWDDIKWQFEKFKKIVPNVTNINVIATIFYKIYQCNELKKQYERENNFIYDLVIRMRGDQIFTKKINFDFPLDKILINAYPWGDEDYVDHYQLHDEKTMDHENECLNDRFAVGSSSNIDYVSDLYNHFEELITGAHCVELECILCKYLQKKELEKRNLFFYVKHNPIRLVKPVY